MSFIKLLNIVVALVHRCGIYVERVLPPSSSANFAELIAPKTTNFDLIRVGESTDGGYLIPEDIDGIQAVFSPGVAETCSFEMFFADRGIPCFLIDSSVEGPPSDHINIHFQKKNLGLINDVHTVTLDTWVKSSANSDTTDLILQMDIEGAEYEVLLTTPKEVLCQFRILVIEFHRLDAIDTYFGNKIIMESFNRLLEFFTIVHIHPNNCSPIINLGETEIHPVAEFTFLRNDRISEAEFSTTFPHQLDTKNVKSNPDVVLTHDWQQSSPVGSK